MSSDYVQNKMFVGGLAAMTTSESLAQHFSVYGPVEDCEVMFDKITGRSRGFGFCTFRSPDSLAAALAEQWAIVVDGKAVECKPCMSKAASGSRYADAPLASAAVGGVALPPRYGAGGGCEVVDTRAVVYHGTAPSATVPRSVENKIFVGGLAPTTTAETLNAHFQRYGQADCVVMMDRSTGRSRGFGFCTFSTAEQAVAALGHSNLAEHIIDGKVTSARICRDKVEETAQQVVGWEQSFSSVGGAANTVYSDPAPSAAMSEAIPAPSAAMSQATYANNRIFVGGLPQSCDDTKLHSYFRQFGALTDVKVMFDRGTQRSRGFGYVSFASSASMEAVIAVHHTIDDKWVEVKRCEEKGSPSLRGAALPGAAVQPGTVGSGPTNLAAALQSVSPDTAQQIVTQLAALLNDPQALLQTVLANGLESTRGGAAAVAESGGHHYAVGRSAPY